MLLSGITISGFLYYQSEHTIQELNKKIEPRLITSEQSIAILEALKSIPKGEVLVTNLLTDTEAWRYAIQIESLLKKAEFIIKENTMGPHSLLAFEKPGAFIIIQDIKHPPPHAVPLQKAFFQEG